MILTTKQEEGLREAVRRYNAGEPWVCISGYAGSGKSTLITFIIQALHLKPEEVSYCAFTGKAAEVLRNKGCPNAITAHKLLYESRPLPDGTYIHMPRVQLENLHTKLIVVDEVSMLPKEMWELLLSHRRFIIASGDPEQLPPINKNQDNRVLEHPHVFLDEIMRQAQESEIIRYSMNIREGKPLKYHNGTEVKILRPEEVIDGMYSWADQIICATNKKRNEINHICRQLKGYEGSPKIGEKIVCLDNHWNILSTDENPLVNGSSAIINDIKDKKVRLPDGYQPWVINMHTVNISTSERDQYFNLDLDAKMFTEGKPTLTPQASFQLSRRKQTKECVPLLFEFGYGITCHRAQGSEWEKVLVFEERFPFEREEHRRWLYTACTRASSRLVIVR